MKHEFPKWIYHKTKEARVVHTQAEEAAHGPEWKSSPAEFGVVTCPNPAEEYAKELSASVKPVKAKKEA